MTSLKLSTWSQLQFQSIQIQFIFPSIHNASQFPSQPSCFTFLNDLVALKPLANHSIESEQRRQRSWLPQRLPFKSVSSLSGKIDFIPVKFANKETFFSLFSSRREWRALGRRMRRRGTKRRKKCFSHSRLSFRLRSLGALPREDAFMRWLEWRLNIQQPSYNSSLADVSLLSLLSGHKLTHKASSRLASWRVKIFATWWVLADELISRSATAQPTSMENKLNIINCRSACETPSVIFLIKYTLNLMNTNCKHQHRGQHQ